ncbi:Transcription factor DIVARICATA [Spatholobus suberectus]|nr:Transcription factor DIVARICATA [Spatholobus suberectus]
MKTEIGLDFIFCRPQFAIAKHWVGLGKVQKENCALLFSFCALWLPLHFFAPTLHISNHQRRQARILIILFLICSLRNKDGKELLILWKLGSQFKTCNTHKRGLKLFGVQLDLCSCSSPSSSSSSSTRLDMRRSFSMDYLLSSRSCPSSSFLLGVDENSDKTSVGYIASVGGGLTSTTQERKKGVQWSEEEHKKFLVGLKKLGKGDWRGIAKSFVTTRTPSQVASHAQKYFLHQNSFNKRKRRHSLLDVGRNETINEPFNTCFEASGQFGFPSGTTCPRWVSYHHSMLNWATTSTNHSTHQVLPQI